ncbi:hypothetical protein AAF712_001658 [Marasmius tenuissimus]|uniref:Proteophosphoglycan ppg4 n=1 Tax=Marasmius tenuissimus TaxID=585030 RepID=A0ABR3AAV0_9AGAR
MFFFSRSRSSRQDTPDDPHSDANNDSNVPNANSESAGESPVTAERAPDDDGRPSSYSPAQMSASRDSEGYPSWLPKRPPPPAPASTFHSSIGFPEPGQGEQAMIGGRKPTPRSIRLVSLEGGDMGEKEAGQPVIPGGPARPRVWSRGAVSALTPTVFSGAFPPDAPQLPRIPQPYFRSRSVNMDILRNPSILFRIYFYLFPVLLFAHIPLQTFFDFNAVFILILVAKHPNPDAPGVPGSGRNWALGAAAYLACWLVWIVVVFLVYEIIYSFVRRWRTKRPPVFPIYTSSPARHLASLTSYSNFCFLQYIRLSAFLPARGGSIRDGFAETLYFYSQNLPTVALLLPRAGLSLALLLAFWTSDPNVLSLVGQGFKTGRDGTFFHQDGTLTGYARGVLAANVAWTVWRALVLLLSWIGLWILSGQAFGGLCGPRYRWEEEDMREKNRSSLYSLGDNNSETAYYDPDLPLPWAWKERTRSRIWDAYEFCLVSGKSSGRYGSAPMDPFEAYRQGYGEPKNVTGSPMSESPGGFEGMDRLMAAVGLTPAPASAQQLKRSVLSDDFFRNPDPEQPVASGSGLKSGRASPPPAGRATPPELAAVIPKVVQRAAKEKQPSHGGPLMELPYPFMAKGTAQVSNEDVEATKDIRIPFPPSPSKSRAGTRTATSRSDDEGEDDDDEEEEEEEDDDDAETGLATTSSDPSSSSARASNSMSSLGLPVTSRYPFQFRHPTTRGSSGSHMTSPSNGRSTIDSRISRQTRSTMSTGNRESTDSHSPRSQYTTSDAASPSSVGGLPMPPRRQGGRGRARDAGPSVPSSPSIDFPRAGASRGRVRGRSSVGSGGHMGPYGMSSPEPGLYSSDLDYEEDDLGGEFDESLMMEQPEPEGPHEADEGNDVVGLLSGSRGPSPRTSMTGIRRRASNSFGSTRPPRLSLPSGGGSRSTSSSGSRSGSNSRTNSHSGSSSGRSRAGSMTGAVRSRTQSLLQTMTSASRSSLDLVQHTVTRTRANSSMARLEEDSDKTHSRSGSNSSAMVSSGGENNTFGHPIPRRPQWQQREQRVSEEDEPPTPGVAHMQGVPEVIEPEPTAQSSSRALRETRSNLSVHVPSLHPSEVTMHGPSTEQTSQDEPAGGLAIPGRGESNESPDVLSLQSSHADISTAAASFVTAPATIATTTDDSGRTVSSWPGDSHMLDRPDAAWRPA